mgnify:FL=1
MDRQRNSEAVRFQKDVVGWVAAINWCGDRCQAFFLVPSHKTNFPLQNIFKLIMKFMNQLEIKRPQNNFRRKQLLLLRRQKYILRMVGIVGL